VSTLCIGNAVSAGAFILAAGQKGKRYALKNSQIMLHQVTAGVGGNIKDMQILMKQVDYRNEILLKEWAKITKHSVQQLKKDIDRDYYMSAEGAIKYGVIDEVLVR
jgi:ATP-dependent Clp protease protease subunit